MKTILQVISDTNIGGGGRSLLNYLKYEDRSRFRSHVVLPRNSALKDPIQALGVPVHEVDAMADRSMDFGAIGPLRGVIREVKPDLIHTHGSMVGRITARLCGRKVIYTKHCVFPLGRIMGSPPGHVAGRVLDACLSDGTIAISPAVRELLLESGVPDKKIHVLYNGVAPLDKPSAQERRALRGEYGFSEDDFVLGILARVESYKGHDVLFDAAEKLLAKGRKVKVLVAGEGSDEARLRQRAAAFPEGSVYFAGFVHQVERVLWAMDVQINASTESEGTSLSLLEGMSIGLPAVVSDVGGNPMLIQHGENGLVFPRRDSDGLCACVEQLMDQPERMEQMARRGEEIFQENFTGESFAKHVMDVYEDVLKGANHGAK